jgi:hypothetical protein
VAVSLAPFVTSARADDDVLRQAERFFNHRGDDRDAYERGRVDQMRQQQAARDWYCNDRDKVGNRDERYRWPDYGRNM